LIDPDGNLTNDIVGNICDVERRRPPPLEAPFRERRLRSAPMSYTANALVKNTVG